MTHVYLAQLKCPNNHCVLALAGEYETQEAAQVLTSNLMSLFNHFVESRAVKYECILCLSWNLHIDVARTVFRTMAEAEPWLQAQEERQRLTARNLKAGRN